MGREREREGDTESEAGSRLQAVSPEPDVGLELNELRDHDLSHSGMFNQLSHPEVLTPSPPPHAVPFI